MEDPRETNGWPLPSSDREELRATKKVRHRADDSQLASDYRGCLIAGSERPATMEDLGHGDGKVLLIDKGDVVIDRKLPVPAVSLSPGLKERLAFNMKNSVVVNLLGRPIGYTILCAKLRQLWDLRGAKIVDMGGGFFLVQLASDEAYQKAVLEGPWTLLGSYLQVQTWTTSFRVHNSSPQSTAVWIRISELPLHLYPSEVISAIGEAVGKVIRVDSNTSGMQRGKFARLAVDVDLTKPLVSKISIDGEEFKIEYENLQELCFHCGMYGHLCDVCIHRPKEIEGQDQGEGSLRTGAVSTQAYGPWMKVERKRKNSGKSRGFAGGHEGEENRTGSRFDVLQEEEYETTKETDTNALQAKYSDGAEQDGRLNGSKGKFKKDKQTAIEVRGDRKELGSGSRNSRPAKTTLGEFFDYTSKTAYDERIVLQATTLDAHKHLAVRVERGLASKTDQLVSLGVPRDDAEEGSQGSEIGRGCDSMMEPVLERHEEQESGRPPDLVRDVSMTSEEGGVAGRANMDIENVQLPSAGERSLRSN